MTEGFYRYTDLDTVPREALQDAIASEKKVKAEFDRMVDRLAPLAEALRVLVAVHTRNHESSFAITTGVTPSSPGADEQNYVEAWRTVRRYLGMPS